MVIYYRSSIQNVNNRRFGKTNALLYLINNQLDIDKIYLYAKDPYEARYQYLIKKREGVGVDHFNDPKTFIEYSNNMHDVYKNIDKYNPDKENKILIAFDDMIADMIYNKTLNLIAKLFFLCTSLKKSPKTYTIT